MLLLSLGFLHFTWIDVLDIAMVAFIIFLLFKWIRGSSAMNIFVAIILFIALRFIAVALDMKMMSSLLGTVIDLGALALVVIFQPEIRKFLGNIGRTAGSTIERRRFIDRFFPGNIQTDLSAGDINELSEAVWEMGRQKTGALIIVRKKNFLDDIIATGDLVDAKISCRLIMNIFFKNSPLHDGAMVIGNRRVIAARCTLPITERTDLPARYGMRHKAAVGMSEQCDADIIVVSEETGDVSYVKSGVVSPVSSLANLRNTLQNQQIHHVGNE